MSGPREVSLKRLLWHLAGWLPVCYALWYVAAAVLMAPAVVLVRGGLALTLPEVVEQLRWAGTRLEVYTSLPAAGGAHGFALEALAYGYGMPLLAALLLASAGPRRWMDLILGLAALTPFVAGTLYLAVLRALLTSHGPLLVSDPDRLAWITEAVQFGARLGALVVTPLLPVLLWAWLQRDRLRRLLTPATGEAA